MTNRKPHILYIDDDEGLRRLTAKALARRGYQVSLAASGAEGVALARDGDFDLIAVDHYMPGQDGLATLGEIASLPAPPPVVYVTGSEESRVAVAALKAGAADYVVKTVGEDFFDLLANAIGHALAQRQLRSAKEEVEEELRASNARLEALLREVNHRVANSLQLVSAMVQMQARSIDEEAAKTALEDTQRRIGAIAQVHRRLYTSNDVESVDMGDYLAALIAELEETWSTPASPRNVRLSSAAVRLKTDRAVSVGVIVNELVSNACKYAYAPDQPGEIRVELALEDDERFRLCVEDDGCGLDAGASARGTGLGTKLVHAMAKALQSELVYDPDHPGVRISLAAAR